MLEQTRPTVETDTALRFDLPLVPTTTRISKAELADAPVLAGRIDRRRYLLQTLGTTLPLLVADLIGLGAALAVVLAFGSLFYGPTPVLVSSLAGPLALGMLLAFALTGLYPAAGLHAVSELRQLMLATTIVFAVSASALWLQHGGQGPRVIALLLTWPLTVLALPLARQAARAIASRSRWWGFPLLVFGAGPQALAVYRMLQSQPRLGLKPLGLVDDRPLTGSDDFCSLHLGPFSEAPAIARKHAVYWAVVALADRKRSESQAIIARYASGIPHLLVIPDLPEFEASCLGTFHWKGKLAIHAERSVYLPACCMMKAALDLTLGLLVAVAALPLLVLLAVLIKLDSRGPVFYCHRRIGRDGRSFGAWKFRTMVVDADRLLQQTLARDPDLQRQWALGHKLRRDPRITRLGRLLRVTSLDELPQIWNVLRGDMSLVGPRPIVDAEIDRYGDKFPSYAMVLPGITGLWQVSGRNHTSYERRVELDDYYVRHWTPWLDLYILARTVKVVLRCEGAY